MNPPSLSPVGWRKPAVRAFKAVVAILIFWGIGRHVLQTWDDLASEGAGLVFRPAWLFASGLTYLIGLSFCGAFYHNVVAAGSTPIPRFAAQRAYLVSHLGKYVPGKAVVVVMRAALSTPYGARASTSAVATFYETLVMMASGSLIAALVFAIGGVSPIVRLDRPVLGVQEIQAFHLFAILAAGMGAGFLALVAPPIFRRAAGVLLRKVPGVAADALPETSWRLLARGLTLTTVSWVFLGLSQAAAARGLTPAGSPTFDLVTVFPTIVASVALATVAGFVVAVAPGGLGVRESVLMYALAPALGSAGAIASALVLRLVWVVAEVLAAAVLVPAGATARAERIRAAEALQEAVPISEVP